MSDERTPRRVFSEKEVSRMLRRATELQEAAKTTDPTGLTFEELQEIAQEAGIDPQYMAAAMIELENKEEVDERFYWLGAPLSVNVERVIPGEVSERQWEEMVNEIRKTFKLVGASGRVGQSREWTHDSKERQAQVTVTSRDGQTKLRLFTKYSQLAAVVFFPAMGMMFGLAAALGQSIGLVAPLVLTSFIIASLGTLFLALRFLFSRIMRTQERKARDLLARMEQIVLATEHVPATVLETTPLSDALHITDAEEATHEIQSSRSRQRL